MRKGLFVGFDTSNYTTSVAVVNEAGEVLYNGKVPLPVKAGECGLRQSDAVFAHVRNLPVLTETLREVLAEGEILSVGCSARPRSVEGSYMPCFLAGRAAAGSLAAGVGASVEEFSHQDGHLMAALYSSGAMETLEGKEFVAFHVSGGTTEVLYVTPTADAYRVECIGGTLDLNAGQAVDRAGVMMGLAFPCGREMERLAGENSRPLPKPRVRVKGTECNLSGLQNLAEKLWSEHADAAYVSAYVLSFIGETLRAMTAGVDARYGTIPVVYAGGVMSNRILQGMLATRADTYFAEPQFSADNAAGIALLTRRKYLRASHSED